VFGLNYLDKTTLSYASIMGLKEDINLKGDEYQWLGSIFYIGWLAWEVSSAQFLAPGVVISNFSNPGPHLL
jgi:ACS family allantoate permease-like MFS transporter